MSGKPGEADAPAEPLPEEPGATFIRPPTEERTQDLVPSPSLDTFGAGDPDLPRLRPEELLAGRFSIVRFIARGVEDTQVPMFKGLGTPAKDKRHLVLEAGHVPPNDVLTQEVLDWLDRYLGSAGG